MVCINIEINHDPPQFRKYMNTKISGNQHETSYYEDDAIWSQDFNADPNERARLVAATALIPSGTRSLLDVGCGNGAFLHCVGERVPTLHGIDRSVAALKYLRVPHTQASADDLPFENGVFETVSCLEVIEHLPQVTYQRALRELTRVARNWILVGVPWRENTAADRVTCPRCFCYFNRSYHLRSFDEPAMRTLFTEVDSSFTLTHLSSVGDSDVFLGLNTARRLLDPFRRPRLPTGSVCPQCGYCNDETSATAISKRATESGAIIRKLLPRMKRPRWYLGLYQKREDYV